MGFYDSTPLFQFRKQLELVERGKHEECVPLHVRLEFTEVCNLQCRFCWWHGDGCRLEGNHINHTGKRSLPRERALALIDEMIRAGTLAVSFTGAGDPLMYPHMAEVLQKIVDNDLAFGVTSNFAMPLSDDVCSLLCHASWLRVSMNAASPDCYRYLHNPRGNAPEKAFIRMQDNVSRIAEEGHGRFPDTFVFNGSFVISDTNWKDVGKACYLARDLGLDALSFRPDIPMAERQEEKNSYRQETLDMISAAREELERESFRIYSNEMMHENNVLQHDGELLCYYMNHTAHVESSGDVYPCCFTRADARYAIGNIMNMPFDIFWKSKGRSEMYKRYNQDYCPPCTYGRYNQALKPLYLGEKRAEELCDTAVRSNPFI